MGRTTLAYWRWKYRHPNLNRCVAWAVAIALCLMAVFLAMAVPDRGLMVR